MTRFTKGIGISKLGESLGTAVRVEYLFLWLLVSPIPSTGSEGPLRTVSTLGFRPQTDVLGARSGGVKQWRVLLQTKRRRKWSLSIQLFRWSLQTLSTSFRQCSPANPELFTTVTGFIRLTEDPWPNDPRIHRTTLPVTPKQVEIVLYLSSRTKLSHHSLRRVRGPVNIQEVYNYLHN